MSAKKLSLVFVVCMLSRTAGADAEPSPNDTCATFVHKMNQCVPGANYNEDAITTCAADLYKRWPVCQALAADLLACEHPLACDEFLAQASTACTDQDQAYALLCGDRAQRPTADWNDIEKAANAKPTFQSLSFHLRAARKVFGTEKP